MISSVPFMHKSKLDFIETRILCLTKIKDQYFICKVYTLKEIKQDIGKVWVIKRLAFCSEAFARRSDTL